MSEGEYRIPVSGMPSKDVIAQCTDPSQLDAIVRALNERSQRACDAKMRKHGIWAERRRIQLMRQ